MGIARGVPWGTPEDAAPDLTIEGDDADLALALRGAPPGVLVAFVPSPESDLARAVGLTAGIAPRGMALPMDALELADGSLAVNCMVLGSPPDRLTALRRSTELVVRLDGREQTIEDATTLVVATGQWLRGLDLVPRGHPGDGRAEVQVYRLRRAQRRPMRARLLTGTHLPHPRIVARNAVAIDVRATRPLPFEIDGRAAGRVTTVRAVLVPTRYRLLV
jgi:YegS C-terminal NAD kinase beta sandwich-like domain